MMRVRRRTLLIAGGVVAFLLLSALLARWLGLENVERDDIATLLAAQARGDSAAMLAQLPGCAGRCRAIVLADATRLKRAGSLLILADQSQTAYSLTSSAGETRVAWKATGTALPVVQCIRVQRSGNAISGLTISLRAVSLPIPGTADC